MCYVRDHPTHFSVSAKKNEQNATQQKLLANDIAREVWRNHRGLQLLGYASNTALMAALLYIFESPMCIGWSWHYYAFVCCFFFFFASARLLGQFLCPVLAANDNILVFSTANTVNVIRPSRGCQSHSLSQSGRSSVRIGWSRQAAAFVWVPGCFKDNFEHCKKLHAHTSFIYARCALNSKKLMAKIIELHITSHSMIAEYHNELQIKR